MRIRMAIFFTLLTSSLALTNNVALAGPPPQSTAPYIIKGRVQDSSGQPLPGVRVCASPKDRSSKARTVCEQSASDGGFLILQNRSGVYLLDASKAGHVSPHLPFYREPGSPLVEVNLIKRATDTFALMTLAPKNGVFKGRHSMRRPSCLLSICGSSSATPTTHKSVSVKARRAKTGNFVSPPHTCHLL